MKKSTPACSKLPFHQWPEEDQHHWHSIVTPVSPLDDGGTAAHWSPATQQINAERYGYFLNFLRQNGRLTRTPTPADRITPANISAFYEHVQVRLAPYTCQTLIVSIKEVGRAMAPEKNWRWLQDICNRLQQLAKDKRKDKRDRIRPTDEIYHAALKILNEHI